MKIDYLKKFKPQNIDINKLRPGKSYDYLIENRNASLSEILKSKDELEKLLIFRDCPVCKHNSFEKIIHKDNLDIVKCNHCNTIYTNPVFNEEKYLEIYQGKNYQEIVKKLGEESHLYRKNRFGKERMDFIEKFHDKELPRTYLDIGCSTGFIIEEGNERGWKTTGIELNPSAVTFAKERNLNVLDLPIEKIAFDNKFSAVSLFDVLEHLINPKKILKIIHDILEPNGNIFIYVPNFASAYKDLSGVENAHFIWPTHHLTYFTPETLKLFLEDNGFEVFHWETQGLDIFDYLWYVNEKTNYNSELLEMIAEKIQFYINAGGHGKNLRMYARKKSG